MCNAEELEKRVEETGGDELWWRSKEIWEKMRYKAERRKLRLFFLFFFEVILGPFVPFLLWLLKQRTRTSPLRPPLPPRVLFLSVLGGYSKNCMTGERERSGDRRKTRSLLASSTLQLIASFGVPVPLPCPNQGKHKSKREARMGEDGEER